MNDFGYEQNGKDICFTRKVVIRPTLLITPTFASLRTNLFSSDTAKKDISLMPPKMARSKSC